MCPRPGMLRVPRDLAQRRHPTRGGAQRDSEVDGRSVVVDRSGRLPGARGGTVRVVHARAGRGARLNRRSQRRSGPSEAPPRMLVVDGGDRPGTSSPAGAFGGSTQSHGSGSWPRSVRISSELSGIAGSDSIHLVGKVSVLPFTTTSIVCTPCPSRRRSRALRRRRTGSSRPRSSPLATDGSVLGRRAPGQRTRRRAGSRSRCASGIASAPARCRCERPKHYWSTLSIG